MPPKNKTKNPVKGPKEDQSQDRSQDRSRDQSKDKLWKEALRLQEELDRVRKEKGDFQGDRDKAQVSWDISKRRLEETEARLRTRLRQREEAKERHRVEITVYEQKLRNVLSEQHNEISELKVDTVASSSLVQNQNMESELRLRRDAECLQADFREMKLHDDSCIKELQLIHQAELMELNNHYEHVMREIEVNYHQKRQLLIKEEDDKRTAELAAIDQRMKKQIATLTEDHDRSLKSAETFLSELQETVRKTKTSVMEQLKQEQQRVRTEQQLVAAQKENQRLREAQRGAEQRLLEARTRLQQQAQAKAKVVESRAQNKREEKEINDVTVKRELLLQACQKVELECAELQKKQMDTISDVQQRGGLKEMMLQRKVAALMETLERKQMTLYAALSVSNADPTAISSAAKPVEEILESKDATISALQEDLARQCKEYDELLHTSRERLRALNIPLQDFSFTSSNEILNTPTPKP